MAKIKTGPKVRRKGGGVAAKADKVSALASTIGDARSIVLTEYRGLTVQDLQDLRRKLRAKGVEYHVVKNTLFERAASGSGRAAITPLLAGPTAIALPGGGGRVDEVELARALVDEMRTFKALKLTGALIGDRAYGADDVTALSRLPSRPQLLGTLVGTITAPLGDLTSTLGAPLATLIHVLSARAATA